VTLSVPAKATGSASLSPTEAGDGTRIVGKYIKRRCPTQKTMTTRISTPVRSARPDTVAVISRLPQGCIASGGLVRDVGLLMGGRRRRFGCALRAHARDATQI
jgi:hypothetical protein